MPTEQLKILTKPIGKAVVQVDTIITSSQVYVWE